MSSAVARQLGAVASALALAVAGPPFNAPAVAWLAFAPLLWGVARASIAEAVALGALAGAVCVAIVAYGVLLYNAELGLLMPLGGAVVFAAFAAVAAPLLRDARRGVRVVGPALAWIAVEWVATLPALSFPTTAGVLLERSPAVMLARVVGVHGLSFLLVLSSASVVEALRDRPQLQPIVRGADAALAAAPALLALALGVVLGRAEPAPVRSVRYRAIQPAIPYQHSGRSWFNPSRRIDIRDDFATEVRLASTSGVDLVLWPEGSEMISAFRPADTRRWLPELYRGSPVYLVSSTDLAANGLFRNRVWAFDGEETPRVYQKQWLVPVAERQYEPGESPDGVLRTPVAAVGPLVCFESCFPEPSRRQAAAGATLLFASVSDAAFRETALPLWHRAAATLRAVETGRTVLYVSNRGPSAEIDPLGRVRRTLPFGRRGLLEGEAQVYDGLTPFVQWGYWLPLLAYPLLALVLVRAPPRVEVAASAASPGSWALGVASGCALGVALIAVSVRLSSAATLGLGTLWVFGPVPAESFAAEQLQQSPNTCGPTALAYLLSYLGDPVTERDIAERVTLRPDGTTLRDLRDAATALGYRARGESRTYDGLAASPLPLIAHLTDAHYVVVLGADREGVRMFDPLEGLVRVDRLQFAQHWSGNVLVVEPTG